MTNRQTNVAVLLFALLAALLASTPAPAFAQGNGNGNGNGNQGGGGGPNSAEYTFVTLDDRPGYARSGITDLIKIGSEWYCAGYQDEDVNRAVIWQVSPDGSDYAVTTHYLADRDIAAGINELGEIVGRTDYNGSGLYWSSHTANPLILPPLAGDNQTDASGINVDGVIVGSSTYRYFDGTDWVVEKTAVAWSVIGFGIEIRGPFVLGQSNPSWGEANAVNDCDATTGIAQAVGATELGPVGWVLQCEPGGDITVLSGPDSLVPPENQGWGTATGINNLGDSCGYYSQDGQRPFRRLEDGTFEMLSSPHSKNNNNLAAYATSHAYDINDNRQVVGKVEDQRSGTSKRYGALWEADGSRVDLNKKLGPNDAWQLIRRARAIDSEGNIGATGTLNENGESRALLMIKN